MQAFQCDELAAPPRLQRRHVDMPKPGRGEVLIAVRAAGIGYADALICAGRYQVRRTPPFTPASEAAGTVVAVGEGVGDFREGDPVVALVSSGALATHAVAHQAMTMPLPAGLPFAMAAACVVNYATASYGLAELGHAAASETLLVLGAGGGLGLAAIDLARMLGVRTIALASSAEKRQAASDQGASLAVDSSSDTWRMQVEEAIGKGAIDLVFDPVGGALSEQAFRLLRPGGRHLVLGFASGEIGKLPMNLPLLKRSTLVGVDWGGAVRTDASLFRRSFDPCAEALAAGTLRPARVETVRPEQAADVMARLLARDGRGKYVADIPQEPDRD